MHGKPLEGYCSAAWQAQPAPLVAAVFCPANGGTVAVNDDACRQRRALNEQGEHPLRCEGEACPRFPRNANTEGAAGIGSVAGAGVPLVAPAPPFPPPPNGRTPNMGTQQHRYTCPGWGGDECDEAVSGPGRLCRRHGGLKSWAERRAERGRATAKAGEPVSAPANAQTHRMGLVEALRAVADSFTDLAEAVQKEGGA